MTLWDDVKEVEAGQEVLAQRPDGSYWSGVVLAKDSAAKTLEVANPSGRFVLDYSKEPEPAKPEQE